jgi:selenocysteine-specific elongation factor
VSALDPKIGTEELKAALLEKVSKNTFVRETSKPFLMAVDHCFNIKGQGTIATGTVLQGVVKINDVVEFPSLRETKKVKSIQSFRVSVNEARAGDRIGMCVPGLDAAAVERTVVCAPGFVLPSVRAGILTLDKIPFFKRAIESKKKYHVSIGYETVTARVTLFRSPQESDKFDPSLDYEFVEEIGKDLKTPGSDNNKKGKVFALVEFDRPVLATMNSLVIGSDLQSEDENACRLAFSGSFIDCTQDKQFTTTYLPTVKVFKEKSKEGSVDRIVSENQLIAKGFCKKESNIDHLVGLKVKVTLPDANELNIVARIESRFGQTNKVRLSVLEAISSEDMKLLKNNIKQARVLLNFKKYFYGGGKAKLIQ